jgi:hypothetical protein
MLLVGLVSLGASGHGISLTNNTGLLGAIGNLLFFLGVLLTVGAGLCWWAVWLLRRGSNRARWIVGILAGLSVPYGVVSILLLHSGVIDGRITIAYSGCIFYGLLIDAKVRGAFSGHSTKLVANEWK